MWLGTGDQSTVKRWPFGGGRRARWPKYIVCLRKPNYDPSTPPNVTQHYCAILEPSKLYMLVGVGQ